MPTYQLGLYLIRRWETCQKDEQAIKKLLTFIDGERVIPSIIINGTSSTCIKMLEKNGIARTSILVCC